MDNMGNNSNNMILLVFGVIIGLLVVLFVVPLAANVIATQTVADAANDALSNMDSYNTLPSSTSSVLPSVSTQQDTSQASSNNTESTKSASTSEVDTAGMHIISGSITTGSSLSSKSSCSVFVGSEYAGAKVKISTLYSRDGSNLNSGKLVSKTVDSKGYVSVKASDSYDLYPDSCAIELYDSHDNFLDSKYVTLSTDSGTQSF